MSKRALNWLLILLTVFAIFVFVYSFRIGYYLENPRWLGVLANAASITGCFGLALAVLFFYWQERSARESSSNTAVKLEILSSKLKEDIDRLEKEVSVLRKLDEPEAALRLLREWFRPDRGLVRFWWRSGYSGIPVFWARDSAASEDIVQRLCSCRGCEVSLKGPNPNTFKQLAEEAARALSSGAQDHPKATQWTEIGDGVTKQAIEGDYEKLKSDFDKANHKVNERLERKEGSIAVNWAIAKFEDADKQWEYEMIVFFDKSEGKAVFLRDPEVRMTDNRTFAKLVIQEFESEPENEC